MEQRRAKRRRLKGQARGYYPRVSKEEMEGKREIGEIERAPTLKAGEFGTTKPGPTTERTHRETRAAMREGTGRASARLRGSERRRARHAGRLRLADGARHRQGAI